MLLNKMEKVAEKMYTPENYITIQKCQLSKNPKTTTQKFIEKMCLLNCKNNLKGVNYNKYGTKGHKIYPISEIFCDNFLLSAPAEVVEKKNTLVGYYNQRIRAVLIKHNQPSFIKAVITNGDRQRYKISCNSMPLDTAIEIINDPEFEEGGIYLEDIDITQDFAGSFNKDEIIDAMVCPGIKVHGKEENKSKNGYQGTITMLDNAHYVGDNCLAYVTDYNGKIRSKIYNKFVQEVESESVRENFGHHLYNWCHDKGNLGKTIKAALSHGLLRVETTYYGRVPTKDEMEYTIKKWMETLKPELCYSTPIEKQWICVTEQINRNLVIKCGNIVAVCHWINSLTKKIGGCIKNIDDDRDFHWMAAELTFNKPLDIIFMDILGDNIKIGVNTYTKYCNGDNTAARLVGRKYIYQRGAEDVCKYGLIPNNGVEFYTSKNKCDKKSASRFTLIMDEPIDINYIDKKIVAKEEVLRLEGEQKRMKKEQKVQDKTNLKFILDKTYAKTAKSLVKQKDGDILEICGALQRKTRYGDAYILATKEGDAYWSINSVNEFLKQFKPIAMHKGYKVISALFTIKILEHGWTPDRNKNVKVEINMVTEGVESYINIPLEERPVGQPKDYRKLEELEAGMVLEVKSYGILSMRGKDRWVIFTDKGNFIDNPFLNEKYKNMEELVEHKIVCLGPRTTKQKHKAMSVRVI